MLIKRNNHIEIKRKALINTIKKQYVVTRDELKSKSAGSNETFVDASTLDCSDRILLFADVLLSVLEQEEIKK